MVTTATITTTTPFPLPPFLNNPFPPNNTVSLSTTNLITDLPSSITQLFFTTDKLTMSGRRSLLLISKLLQACVNQVQFEIKESFMVRFNPLLTEYSPKIYSCLSCLAIEKPYVAPPRPRHNYREDLKMLNLLVQHTHQNWESVSLNYTKYLEISELKLELASTSDLIKSLDDLVTCFTEK
eukprot:TRINITY_DN14492_c0_g1_i20.p1 TRINITY_DN14492_c0_g1~~TRINITY_DN14492_c0_g1_i20.p1  ORF type:complete len:181 (-),score=36.72 TRINITY_DN14492_c0_g1_i20:684-1226(-)